MTSSTQTRFEDFVLNPSSRELRRQGELVAIEPQVFDLLVYVLQNRDRVVSKDDLIQAVWGGRIVSDSTLTTRINAMRKALGDSGEDQRLIRTVARKGIRFIGEVTEGDKKPLAADPAESPTLDRSGLPLPDKPSIAVLPFQNMSGDPEQEYLVDSIVDEIITALSRFRALFVISRNSTFTYKGRAVDIKQVAHELGVRYVLEGSVRRAGSKVRVSGQLIDAINGAHLWADRFDSDAADPFDLQDRLTVSVVGAIAPKIEAAEIELARRKPVANLDSYHLCLRARSLIYSLTRDGTREARDLLEQAVRLDPFYALAAARLAGCYSWRANNGWADDAEAEGIRALQLARNALALDKNDPEVLGPVAEVINRFERDLVEAQVLVERALSLNVNSADAWAFSGFIQIFAGNSSVAITHFEQALRISPLGPTRHFFLGGLGVAYFGIGDLEKAVEVLTRATKEQPNNPTNFRFLASALAQLHRVDEARQAALAALNVDPKSTISTISRRTRHHPTLVERYLGGLRMAGYPE